MDTKNMVITVLAVLTLFFGYQFFTAGHPLGAANPTGQQHYQQEAFLQGITFGSRSQSYFDSLGNLFTSVTGSYTDNGEGKSVQHISMTKATTTPCAIKSPTATSTLTLASALINTATSSTITMVWGKSSTPYATTTVLGNAVQSTGGVPGIVASSTAANLLNNDFIFAPNTYLVLSIAGGITGGDMLGTGYNPGGTCNGNFVVL